MLVEAQEAVRVDVSLNQSFRARRAFRWQKYLICEYFGNTFDAHQGTFLYLKAHQNHTR